MMDNKCHSDFISCLERHKHKKGWAEKKVRCGARPGVGC